MPNIGYQPWLLLAYPENLTDFPTAWEFLVTWSQNHATAHSPSRCSQAEKRATARSSTFHFARTSQNKKSFHCPTATQTES